LEQQRAECICDLRLAKKFQNTSNVSALYAIPGFEQLKTRLRVRVYALLPTQLILYKKELNKGRGLFLYFFT
jgi:hypothetical protein